jgi:prepilin peptidase CpaA
VTLGGLLAGLAIQTGIGIVDGGIAAGARAFAFALGGAIACAILPFLAWRRNELGGGDVKLFAAIGALVGPVIGFDVEALAFGLALIVLLPYRIIRYRNLKALPPVILAPTIGVAFAVTLFRTGAMQ